MVFGEDEENQGLGLIILSRIKVGENRRVRTVRQRRLMECRDHHSTARFDQTSRLVYLGG